MIVLKAIRLPLCQHRFTLTGLNLERFLNAAQKEGIALSSVQRMDGRTLNCRCHSADLPRLSALAQEKGWRMEQTAPCGLSAAFERTKRRPGIPLGILLALVTVFGLSRFIWQVDIHNAGPYRAEISAYLQECGYRPGTLRSSVHAKEIEQALTLRYPDLAWFHVYVTNVTLVVDVTSGVSMPHLPSAETGSVTAACDGIVDSIRVYAGTAQVKPGDAVRKGQVLIRGEERSSNGQLTSVQAEGVVMARCWYSCTVEIPLNEVHSSETGRENSQICLVTPRFSLPLQGTEPDFLAWNIYQSQLPLGGVFFPLAIQKTTFRETAMEYVPRNEQEVREEAAQAALKQLKTALFGDEIIDKWVDYCMIEGDTLAATATAERLMDIGETNSP